MGAVYRQARDMEWQPHPEAPGLLMKPLLELPEEGLTVRLHKIPPGGIPEHKHARRHIMWVTSGRGRLWVDGDEMELSPGAFVCIPSNASHRFENLDGDLELYTVSMGPEKNKRVPSP